MSGVRQVTHSLGLRAFGPCVGEEYTPLPSCPEIQGSLLYCAPIPHRDWLTTSEGRSRQAHLWAGADPAQIWHLYKKSRGISPKPHSGCPQPHLTNSGSLPTFKGPERFQETGSRGNWISRKPQYIRQGIKRCSSASRLC